MTKSLILNIILLLVVCCGVAVQRTNFFSFSIINTSQAENRDRYAPAEQACSAETFETHEHDAFSHNLPAETFHSPFLAQHRRLNQSSAAESTFLNIISPPPEKVT